MQLFYCPEADNAHYLDEQESFHASKVLRHAAGDVIHIIDGRGNLYSAQITSVAVKKVSFTRLELIQSYQPASYSIHIAVAPVKSADRNEWFVEKAVELGIDEISFVSSQRSEKKTINIERMRKVAVSAMKQSGKARLPHIHQAGLFKEFIQSSFHGQKFIPNLLAGEREHLINLAGLNSSYLVIIGPEGDFTKQEVEIACDYGFQPVTLGNSVLRTETAAIAACHILNLIHEQK